MVTKREGRPPSGHAHSDQQEGNLLGLTSLITGEVGLNATHV